MGEYKNNILKKYEVISVIKKGALGERKKIRRIHDGKVMQLLVCKEIFCGTYEILFNEVTLLKELDHKHIVQYYDSTIDESAKMVYIITEYREGGDLSGYIAKWRKSGKRVEESFVWKVCYQLVSAVEACHNRLKDGRAIIHRNIKPANVFLTADQDVKLGGFSLTRILDRKTSMANARVGNTDFIAPDLMNGEQYNEKVDIWSLGCLSLALCLLRNPDRAMKQEQTNAMIGEIKDCYSPDLVAFISSTLQHNPMERPTAKQLLPALYKKQQKVTWKNE